MNRILIIFFGVIFFITLLGCHHKHSYNYYLLHPDRVRAAYKACQSKGRNQELSDECKNVIKARQTIIELLNQQRDDQYAFGEKIIAAQQNLARLKKTLATTASKKEHQEIKENIEKAGIKVQELLAIVRLSEQQ